ncbi:glycosyltransferase [Fusobacterium gastrosuis]|uniref:glycosyltransferase n=1 Tax=Fusobacterium gastrosuis TaxID=1755100 RepID=UPI0029722B32|nr:glycosyltransferase [Fusobacteriaceae bacterium]MDY5712910.1 glycosyltransferase [Fusobacterium gastrosuis]
MSTYNGELYLKEQINSILEQEDVKVDIWIRDDGSVDSTVQIINDYMKEYSNIKYYTGKNLKSAQSFIDLLYTIEGYDYYAFADQDDVWYRRKLIEGIKYLKDDYHLYGCKKEIVNENLEVLNKKDEYPKCLELGVTILRCKISGCTMIFDRFLKNKLMEYRPQVVTMHDSWVLKVACCVGKVYFDSNKYILYRQHSKNVVGAKQDLLNLWKKRIKNLKKRKKNLTRIKMAEELYRGYSKYLNDKEKEHLYNFINSRNSFKDRIKVIFSNFIKGDSYLDTIILKIIILLGLI